LKQFLETLSLDWNQTQQLLEMKGFWFNFDVSILSIIFSFFVFHLKDYRILYGLFECDASVYLGSRNAIMVPLDDVKAYLQIHELHVFTTHEVNDLGHFINHIIIIIIMSTKP